jgi:hypothetical protein
VLYANDEKAWVKARVHEYLDAGLDYDIVATYLGYQRVFGHRVKRTEVAIGSLMLRIKRVYEKADPASGLAGGLLDEEDGADDEQEQAVKEEEEGEEGADDGTPPDEPSGEHSGSGDNIE